MFSEELRSRFDLVSWDQRGVARSAAVRCFSDAAEQWRFLSRLRGCPWMPNASRTFSLGPRNSPTAASSRPGPILNHASSANTARDLELLRRAVGDPSLTYHGISYGTQLGAIYANLFPGRVRAMVLDGSVDFQGNVNGHGSQGTTVPLNTRQDIATALAAAFEEFLRDCSAAGPALRVLRRRSQRQVGGARGTVSRGTCHHGLRPPVDLPGDRLRHSG